MEAVEDIKKELMAELEKVKLEIQANMQAGGVNASGRTSKSLKVVPYESGVRLISDGTGAPFSTIEAGRKPGKVPYNFVDIIFQWSKNKGIPFADDRERRRFAGAVVWGPRSIRNEGFGREEGVQKRHLPYGNTRNDIYSLAVQKLKSRLLKKYGDKVHIVISIKTH